MGRRFPAPQWPWRLPTRRALVLSPERGSLGGFLNSRTERVRARKTARRNLATRKAPASFVSDARKPDRVITWGTSSVHECEYPCGTPWQKVGTVQGPITCGHPPIHWARTLVYLARVLRYVRTRCRTTYTASANIAIGTQLRSTLVCVGQGLGRYAGILG